MRLHRALGTVHAWGIDTLSHRSIQGIQQLVPAEAQKLNHCKCLCTSLPAGKQCLAAVAQVSAGNQKIRDTRHGGTEPCEMRQIRAHHLQGYAAAQFCPHDTEQVSQSLICCISCALCPALPLSDRLNIRRSSPISCLSHALPDRTTF